MNTLPGIEQCPAHLDISRYEALAQKAKSRQCHAGFDMLQALRFQNVCPYSFVTVICSQAICAVVNYVL